MLVRTPTAKPKPGSFHSIFGGDVRVRGETPLHRASAYAPKEVFEQLLKAGAEKTVGDANGDSRLCWAILHRRRKEIVRLFSYGDFR